jgi:Leucine-rich repeat (LRR) protein
MVMNPKIFIYLPIACVFGLIYRFFNTPEKTSTVPQSPIKPIVYILSSADSTLQVAEQRYEETSYAQAFVLYNEYSNHNSFKAIHMRHFAMLYQWGKGCVADTAKAIYWYKQAVHHGDGIAQSYLQAVNYTQAKFAHSIRALDSTTTVLDLNGQKELAYISTIFDYKQLKTIVLRNCNLTRLPPEIGQLTQLEDLYLEGNSLETLPVEIGNLTHLKTLHLMNNQLTSLPNELSKLTKLEHLDVSNNKMDAFPTLKQLTWLVLDGNAIKQLPENMGSLKQLVHLSLSRNQLKTLPKALFQLTHLEILHLNQNQLTKFPTEIKQLKDLKYLNLAYNQLKQLPNVLCQMKFDELVLSENPYEVVPSCLR